jgi:hypothetical protein
MKRTPLKRRKQMVRNYSSMKRTPIRKVSKEKMAWIAKYARAKKLLPEYPVCAKCRLVRRIDGMQFHHPFGRIGERIMAFLVLCPFCHEMIHDEGAQARALGWLQPEFDGRSGPAPRPWDVALEIPWPESLCRDGQQPPRHCPS